MLMGDDVHVSVAAGRQSERRVRVCALKGRYKYVPVHRLQYLYLDKGMSVAGLCKHFKSTPKQICDALIMAGIERRTMKEQKALEYELEFGDRNREMAAMYKAGETTTTIAAKYGMTRGGVAIILDHQGVPKRPRGVRPMSGDDAGKLADRYCEGFTLKEVAKEFGVTPKTVRRALRQCGVPSREPGRRLSQNVVDDIIFQYQEGRSPMEISRQVGISVGTVTDYLAKNGLRPPTKRKPNPLEGKDDEFLRLWKEGFTDTKLANHFGVPKKAVLTFAQRFRAKGLLKRKLKKTK